MAIKILPAAAGLIIVFILFHFFYGGGPGDVLPKSHFEIVAHRGAHQNRPGQKGDLGRKGRLDRITGCEATGIFKPTHGFIENTIESVEAAFAFGATIVEIDIRRTSDDQLVLFHDGTLECKTNGKGKVGDYPVEYLRKLDVGYGYTHDNGATYPFRGKGIGKMPTLVEALRKFPDRKFLIDHKDGSMTTATLLVTAIKSLPPGRRGRLYYWGADKPYEYIQGQIPAVTRLFHTRSRIKKWLMTNLLTLGLSGFPRESRGAGLGMPAKYTKFAWGWPYRFLASIQEAGARFYLVIDTEEDARNFSNIPLDGIVTDYIEVVGTHFARDK